MQLLLYIGLAIFGAGLVLSHVVLVLSRRPRKEGKPLSRKVQVLMWAALGLSVLGIGLAGAAVLL